MSILEIDLNAKYIDSDVRIWRLFPGRHYGLLRLFLDQSKVFLELPGLYLPEGVWTRGNNSLTAYLSMANQIYDWVQARKAFDAATEPGNPPDNPSRDLQLYLGKAPVGDLSQSLSLVLRLFQNAKKGDLILVPDVGRSRRFYVGEVLDEIGCLGRAELGSSFFHETTVARSVKWFSPVPERLVKTELTQLLRTQNTLIEIPSEFKDDILDVSYGSYYTGTKFAVRFSTAALHFDDQDNLDIGGPLRLAAAAASDFRHGGKIRSETLRIINVVLPDEDKVSLSSNINSPGFLNAHAETIAPLLLAAMLALFGAAHANAQPDASKVRVINSAAPADERCLPEVNAALSDTLRNMVYNDFKDHCLRASRLEDSAKLKGPGVVRRP